MSDSVRPQRQQPTRLPRPWDSPGKNTGVGCHFLLQCRKVKSESEVAQSCPTLCDPMDFSLPGSSTHGIFQARVLEWGAIATDPRPSLNQLVAVPSISLLLLHLVMLLLLLSLQDWTTHCSPVTSTCPNHLPIRLDSNALSPQEASPYSIPNVHDCSHLKTLGLKTLGFPGGSDSKASVYNAGDLGSIPGSGRSAGEGNDNPLQHYCLEIPWTEEPGRLQSMGSQRVGHN